ncbi:S53 family peptidase [Terracoccus luteus]|uniref:Subtilase family serine protease n=1 Tax=Terracoccus luteus TaxID=53356 RepID=A0A839Q2H5_9MICO|nr:S53 family peptidase [Terracoccus luteus]MBB2987302.1 subtilase family serine protease [Terracoccus luteus]MCP2172953.1 subtilase family serine protease [Terracoccus luteus]
MKRVFGKAAIGSIACLGLAVTTVGITAAGPAGATTSSTNGTSGANAGARKVVGAAPSWTARARRTGATPSSTRLHLAVVLNLRDAAGAEALAAAVSDPSSSAYGHYLTPAQWRSRFAPTDADAAAVTAYLRSQGFTVTGTPANHRFIDFDGTAAQANSAFGAQLSTYAVGSGDATAPSATVSVPASIGSLVVGVTGLDSTAVATPLHVGAGGDVAPDHALTDFSKVTTAQANPAPSDTLPPPPGVFKNAGPCSTYYGQKPATGLPQIVKDPQSYAVCGYKPAQLRGAYGTDQALAQGVDGRGATVAVVDAYASPTIAADASTYASRNDPSHPLRGYQLAQSTPATYTYTDECGASGWYGEETLDVEAVHAMAPAANILYVGAQSCQNDDLAAAVNTVLDNGLAQVITNSYGSTGEPGSVAEVQAEHQSALQAAAQGVSLMFSSGDSGDEVHATGTRQVDYEASDPYVTAVGGTALAVTASNGYGWEQGWGTGKSVLTNGAWSPNPPAYVYGGGGGTSRLFTQPGYQKGVVPSSISDYFGTGAHRAVPDVGMLGDPQTGFLVGQTQTFPNGTAKYAEYRIGGTSLASPLFAGVIALANQNRGASLGFLNPRLYRKAGTSAFRDVTHTRGVTDAVVRVDYANGVNAKDGTITSLRTINQTQSIWVRPGYDDVTGVGSPNGVAFLAAMAR